MPHTFQTIKKLVTKIPLGKVSTYGTIAQAVGVPPRVVGWALAGNQDKKVPCHRVVQKGGTLSPGFSLGGWQEQRRRLSAEGLKFSHRQIKNFPDHFYTHPRGGKKVVKIICSKIQCG